MHCFDRHTCIFDQLLIMEYCTEIAILQSAFQLVSEKAGKTLPSLPKENCEELVHIIWTSMEEICNGIEYDFDIKEKLLWQQKLHSVLLYVLVKKLYKEKEEPVRDGRVPVFGALDMFTEIFPTYSCSFYFELMKRSGWTQNFLKSLQCFDYKIASSLFNDLLQHCHSNPVTLKDGEVMAMVKDKLLSRCLCIPDYPSQLCTKLLEPLTQSRNYIQTVFPDDEETYVSMETQEYAQKESLNGKSCVGISFWVTYVETNPQMFDLVMKHFEDTLERCLEMPSQKLIETVSQLAMWLYFTSRESESDISDKWIINNLFVPDFYNDDSVDLKYSLDYNLIQLACNILSKRKLHVCLWKALNALSRSIKPECLSDTDKIEGLVRKFQHNVHIVGGLSVNLIVLLRLLGGLLDNSDALAEKYRDTDTGELELLSWIQKVATKAAVDGALIVAESWKDDVTLESLLWRIDNNLPQYQVCVNRLLDVTNLKFWTTDRLYTSMKKHSELLGHADRVLKLSQISDMIMGDINQQIASTLLDLFIASFSKLSLPDQDDIVMEIYCKGHNSVKESFQKDLTSKVTNVFNKVTADMDSQVLREIILLCLGDPHIVLSVAVSLCVRNEQQARSCALIIHHMRKTSLCYHPVKHPDTSLVAVLLHEFLNNQSLTVKEQKCFSRFVSELMMPEGSTTNKETSLSPAEFLKTIVLPCISVENLSFPNLLTCNFAVELLLIALDAGCERKCDWSKYEFEPMALVLSLAEIQHECVLLWEITDVLPDDIEEKESSKMVSMDTKVAKLPMKEKVNQCIERICKMTSIKNISVSIKDCCWLLESTRNLHWTVRLGLSPLYTACQLDQVNDDWLSALNDLLIDPGFNLVTLVQFVAVNGEYKQTVIKNLAVYNDVSYEEIIHALIQVLPQCLLCQFEKVVSLVEELFCIETLNTCLIYRLQSTHNLPFLDLSELESALFTSQLLVDVILTLVMTLTPGDNSRSLLQHVIQCYIWFMKKQCEKIVKNQDLQLMYLGELFHHVCQVTLHLPAEIMDSTLVFLLHILNKFRDLSKGMIKGQKMIVKEGKIGLKVIKYLEDGMMSAVHSLPDKCEEKSMLLKKLRNQS